MTVSLDPRSQHTCCKADAINLQSTKNKSNRFKTTGNENEKLRSGGGNELEHAQICVQHNTSMKPKGDGTHQ
jgi:hypothetical protein